MPGPWRFGADGRPVGARIAPPAPSRRPGTASGPGPASSGPASSGPAPQSWLLELSQASPSGRYFAPLEPPTPSAPAAPEPIFVVHLVLDGAGFRIAGRPVPPRMIAAAVRACPEWRGRPVLVLPVGPADDAAGEAVTAAAGTLLAGLARALGVPVLGCDRHAFVGPGMVVTDGSFRRWNPPGRRRPGTPKSVDLGPLLPAPRGPLSS
jgi:hypothetical protein